MKEICTLLVKLHIIFSRMQRVNQHARPSIIQVGCPTCCYQVCAPDHANGGTADQGVQFMRTMRPRDGGRKLIGGAEMVPLNPFH